jgi:hypothetical protein
VNGPLFWKLLTAACLFWYATITVYVTFRGAADIRAMLRRLAENQRQKDNGCASCRKGDGGE